MTKHKLTYFDMIKEALAILNDRIGSTRDEIFKCIQARHPDTDKKQFIMRLRYIVRDEKEPVKANPRNKMRFLIEKSKKKVKSGQK